MEAPKTKTPHHHSIPLQIAKAILSPKEQPWGLGTGQSHCATEPKWQTSWSCTKAAVSSRRDSETKPTQLQPPKFCHAVNNVHWGKESLFDKWRWENWTSVHRRTELDPEVSPCTKSNPKWMRGLAMVLETWRLLETHAKETLQEKTFLKWTPAHREYSQELTNGLRCS